MSVFIATDIKGDERIKSILDTLPVQVRDEVSDELAQYLVGQFKTYPQFKHVERKKAYPETGDGFFSDKQRRWFFANLREGNIPPPSKKNRSGAFKQGWQILGKGQETLIVNETSYGPFLMGNTERARLSELAGWKTMDEVIERRKERIDKLIKSTMIRVMKRLGLSKARAR